MNKVQLNGLVVTLEVSELQNLVALAIHGAKNLDQIDSNWSYSERIQELEKLQKDLEKQVLNNL